MFKFKLKVTPWEVDQNLYCTPPRTFNESTAANYSQVIPNVPTQKIAVNLQQHSRLQQQNIFLLGQQQIQQQFERSNRNYRRPLAFFTCILQPDPMMSSDIQAQCLPVDLRGDRRTIKLIRVNF